MRAALCLAAVAVACAGPPPATAPTPAGRTFNLTVRPVRAASNVSEVAVEWILRDPRAPSASRFSVRAPITYASVTGIADSIRGLIVRDAQGPVSLRQEDDPVNRGGFPYYRHWRAERSVQYPVSVAYRARARVTGGTGPQFALQAYAGGVSMAGSGFLVVPEDSGATYTTRVRWDLSELARGSIAASTFGDGDFELRGSPDRLMQGYYMAGPVGRAPRQGSAHGFTAYWLGQPPFDPERELEWATRCYEYLRSFFRDTTTSPFRMFVRVLPGQQGYPGTALGNSFMLGTPVGTGDSTRNAPRETLTHEMVHHWAVGIQGTQGANTWFHEGLAVFFSRLLLMRSGLGSVDDYGRSINATARGYYTNPLHNLSADSIGRLGFATGVGGASAQNVPYTRGSLYFADVDAQIRAVSGGRRKVEDVLLPMFEKIRRGERVDQQAWIAAVVAEIGPSARQQFEAVIVRGETIVPRSDAFGPCFERRPTKFNTPRGDVDGYEWVRVPAVPDATCRAVSS